MNVGENPGPLIVFNDNFLSSKLENQEKSQISVIRFDYSPKVGKIFRIEPLKKFFMISDLSLIGHSISNLSPLQSLKNLKRLNLSYNEISKITDLYKIPTLEVLCLNHNIIENITSGISELKRIKTLRIAYNPLNDKRMILNLKPIISLSNLDIEGTPIGKDEDSLLFTTFSLPHLAVLNRNTISIEFRRKAAERFERFQIEELSQINDRLSKQNEELMQQIKDNADSKNQNQTIRNELESLLMKIRLLEKENEEKDNIIHLRTQELANERKINADMRTQFDSDTDTDSTHVSELKVHNLNLKTQNESLISDLNKTKQELKVCELELAKSKHNLSNIEKDLNTADTKIEEIIKENNELKSTILHYQNENNLYQQECDHLKMLNIKQQEYSQKVEEEMSRINEISIVANSQSGFEKSKIVEDRIRTLTDRNKKLANDLREKEALLFDVQKKNESLISQIQASSTQVNQLDDKKSDSDQYGDSLSFISSEKQLRLRDESEKKALEDRIRSLEVRITTLQSDVSFKEKKLSELNDMNEKITRLENENRETKMKNDEVRGQLVLFREIDDKYNDLKRLLGEKEQELLDLNERYRQVQIQQVNTIEILKKVTDLEQSNSQIEGKLLEKDGIISSLSKEKKSLIEQINELNRMISEIQSKFSNMSNSLTISGIVYSGIDKESYFDQDDLLNSTILEKQSLIDDLQKKTSILEQTVSVVNKQKMTNQQLKSSLNLTLKGVFLLHKKIFPGSETKMSLSGFQIWIQEINSWFEKLQQEKSKLKSEIRQFRERLSVSLDVVDDIDDDQNIEHVFETYEQKAERMKMELVTINQMVMKVDIDLNDTKSRINLNEKVAFIIEEYNNVKAYSQDLEAEIDSKIEENRRLLNQVQSLEKIESVAMEIEQELEKTQVVMSELELKASMQEKHELRIQELTKKLKLARKQNGKLNEIVNEMSSKVIHSIGTVNESSLVNQSIEKENRTLKKQLRKTSKFASTSIHNEQRISFLENKLLLIVNQLEECQSENLDLKNSIKHYESECAKNEITINRLNNDINEYDNSKRDLMKNCSHACSIIREVIPELESNDIVILTSNLCSRVSQLESQNARFKMENSELSSKIGSFYRKLESSVRGFSNSIPSSMDSMLEYLISTNSKLKKFEDDIGMKIYELYCGVTGSHETYSLSSPMFYVEQLINLLNDLITKFNKMKREIHRINESSNQKVSELQSLNESLQQKIDMKNEDLNLSRMEADKSISLANRLESLINDQRSSLEEVNRAKEDTESKNRVLLSTNSDLRASIEKKEIAIGQLSLTVQSLQSKINEQDIIIQRSIKEKENQKSIIDQMHDEISSTASKSKSIIEVLSNQTKKNHELLDELTECKSRLMKISAENSKLSEKSAKGNEYKTENRRLKKELTKAENIIKENETQIKGNESNIKEMRDHINEAFNEKEFIETKHAQLMKDFEKLNQKYSGLKKQRTILRKELEECENRYLLIKRENEEFLNQSNAHTHIVKNAKEQLEIFRNRQSEYEKEIMELKSQIININREKDNDTKRLQELNDDLYQQNSILTRETQKFKENLIAHQNEASFNNHQKDQQLAELALRIQHMDKDYQDLKSLKDSLDNRLQTNDKELAKVQEENMRLLLMIESQKNDIVSFNTRLIQKDHDCREELKQLHIQISKYEEDLENERRNNRRLSEENKGLFNDKKKLTTDIEKMYSRIQTFEENLDEINRTMARADIENNQLQITLRQKEAIIISVGQEKSEIEQNNIILKQEIIHNDGKFSEFNQKIDQLTADLVKKDNEIRKLVSTNKKLEGIIERTRIESEKFGYEIQKENQSLQSAGNHLKETNSDLVNKLNQANKENESLRKSIANLERDLLNEIDNKNSIIIQLQNSQTESKIMINDLERRINDSISINKDSEKEQIKKNEILLNKNTELNRVVLDLKNQNSRALKALQDLVRENERDIEKKQQCEQELRNVESRLHIITEENVILTDTNRKLSQDVEQLRLLKEKNRDLEENLSKLVESNMSFQQQILDLEQNHESDVLSINSLSVKIAGLLNESKQYEERLLKEQNTIHDLQGSIQKYNEENRRLLKENNERDSEIGELHSKVADLDDITHRLQECQDEIQNLSKEVTFLRKENIEMKSKLIFLNEKTKLYQESETDHASRIIELTSRIAEYEQACSTKALEIDSMKTLVEKSNEKYSQIYREFKSQKSTNKSLKAEIKKIKSERMEHDSVLNQNDYEEMRNMNQTMTNRMNDLINENNSLKETITTLAKKTSEFEKNQQTIVFNEFDSLKKNHELLTKKYHKLKGKAVTLRSNYLLCTSQLKESERTNGVLKDSLLGQKESMITKDMMKNLESRLSEKEELVNQLQKHINSIENTQQQSMEKSITNSSLLNSVLMNVNSLHSFISVFGSSSNYRNTLESIIDRLAPLFEIFSLPHIDIQMTNVKGLSFCSFILFSIEPGIFSNTHLSSQARLLTTMRQELLSLPIEDNLPIPDQKPVLLISQLEQLKTLVSLVKRLFQKREDQIEQMGMLIASQHDAIMKISKGENQHLYAEISTSNYNVSQSILESDRQSRKELEKGKYNE